MVLALGRYPVRCSQDVATALSPGLLRMPFAKAVPGGWRCRLRLLLRTPPPPPLPLHLHHACAFKGGGVERACVCMSLCVLRAGIICIHACVCMCARVCVCVRARVRACVRVCECTKLRKSSLRSRGKGRWWRGSRNEGFAKGTAQRFDPTLLYLAWVLSHTPPGHGCLSVPAGPLKTSLHHGSRPALSRTFVTVH